MLLVLKECVLHWRILNERVVDRCVTDNRVVDRRVVAICHQDRVDHTVERSP
jgi:hypothetical protein